MGLEVNTTRRAGQIADVTNKQVGQAEPILFRNVSVSYGELLGVTNARKQSIREFVNEIFKGSSEAVLATSEQVTLKLNPHLKNIEQVVEPGQIKVVARTGFNVKKAWRHSTGPNNPMMTIDVELARFGLSHVLVTMEQERAYFARRAVILMQLPTEQFGELLKKEFGTPPKVGVSDDKIEALKAEHASLTKEYPLNAKVEPPEERSRHFIRKLEDLMWNTGALAFSPNR